VGCLNLVSNIIIWNTIYIDKAVEQLRKEGYLVDDEDLKRLWPTRLEQFNVCGLEQFNVCGRYLFNRKEIRKNRKLRKLRKPPLF
jgi:Tn3 transposase DDE domain